MEAVFLETWERGKKGRWIGEDSLFPLFSPPPPPLQPNILSFASTTVANKTPQCNGLWTYKMHLHPSVSCSWLQAVHRNMTPPLAGRPDQVCPSVFQTRQQN